MRKIYINKKELNFLIIVVVVLMVGGFSCRFSAHTHTHTHTYNRCIWKQCECIFLIDFSWIFHRKTHTNTKTHIEIENNTNTMIREYREIDEKRRERGLCSGVNWVRKSVENEGGKESVGGSNIELRTCLWIETNFNLNDFNGLNYSSNSNDLCYWSVEGCYDRLLVTERK